MTPRERYKKDFQTRLSWMDFSVLKIDGRAFEPDKALIPVDDAKKFPAVSGYDLNGNKSILPHSMDKQMKFVGFSNNQVGGLYVNSWLNPFFDNYKGNDKVVYAKIILIVLWVLTVTKMTHAQVGTVEIHVVERYMLSFLRPLILHRLRSQIPEARHKNTVVMFGGLEVHRRQNALSGSSADSFLFCVSRISRQT